MEFLDHAALIMEANRLHTVQYNENELAEYTLYQSADGWRLRVCAGIKSTRFSLQVTVTLAAYMYSNDIYHRVWYRITENENQLQIIYVHLPKCIPSL